MESDTPKGYTTSLSYHIPLQGGSSDSPTHLLPPPAISTEPTTPDDRKTFDNAWFPPSLPSKGSPTRHSADDEEKEVAPPGTSGGIPTHDDTCPARINSTHLWWYLSIANLAWHAAALASGIYLYRHPHLYPLSTRFFVDRPNFQLTGGAYNALITFVSQVASATALGIFSRIVYAYVVDRLDNKGMSVKSLDKWLSVGGGRIKWKSVSALVYTLPGFILFTAYATSLSVSYTLTPVTVTNTFPMVAINISENAINLGVAFETRYLTGNSAQRFAPDYETTLRLVGDALTAFVPNATDFGKVSIGGSWMMPDAAGMVLGAGLPTTISSRVIQGTTTASPTEKALIDDQYGLNQISFNATGVQANTTCGLPSPRFATTSVDLGDDYISTTFVNTRCGNTTVIHSLPRDRRLVYDVLNCALDDGNITSIVFNLDGINGVREHTVCTTKLFDTRGSGIYSESLSQYSLVPHLPQIATPMSNYGMLVLLNFTERGWLANLGGVGSHGLYSILNGTSLEADTSLYKLSYSLSLMYSLAGAKIINLASSSAQRIFDNQTTPIPYVTWYYKNITVSVLTCARQIGMERETLPWITVTVLHVILGIVILGLAWRHRSTVGVDPSLPTTLHLVRDDVAGRIHAVPAKPSADKMRIVLRHD